MSQIITGVPVRYRVIIEGEVVGLQEAHVHSFVQQGISFSAVMASCNRRMDVTVLPPGKDLPPLPGQVPTA